MTQHLDFDTLNDLAAGEITDDARRDAAERHAGACAECAAQLAVLAELLGRVRNLPRSIEPPDDVWAGVHTAITMGGMRRTARTTAWWRRSSSWMLAAAALVLVASSSAVTAYVMRGKTQVVDAPSSLMRGPALPAALALVEAGYDDTARQLEATLTMQRSRLSPKTIATVEHSLAVIDTAIAEA